MPSVINILPANNVTIKYIVLNGNLMGFFQ